MKKFLFAFLFGLLACDVFAEQCITVVACPAGQTMSCKTQPGCDNEVCTCSGSAVVGPIACFDSCSAVGVECSTTSGVSGTCARNSDGCLYCDTSETSCESTADCNLGLLLSPQSVGGGVYKLTVNSYCQAATKTCVSSSNTWYACGNGYYGEGTSCEPCPADSQYGGTPMSVVPSELAWVDSGVGTIKVEKLQGAADITACYVEPAPDKRFVDGDGNTYYIEEGFKCYHVASGT